MLVHNFFPSLSLSPMSLYHCQLTGSLLAFDFSTSLKCDHRLHRLICRLGQTQLKITALDINTNQQSENENIHIKFFLGSGYNCFSCIFFNTMVVVVLTGVFATFYL